MKKIFAFILSLFAIISCLQEERSPEEILVPTPAQVECSTESLMLTSKVPAGSERLVQDCGFYYSLDKSMSDVRKVEGVLASNNFTAELPERSYGKTYYICSYVTNGHGSEIRSDLRSYTLDELDDYVEFGALDMLSYDKNSSTLEITIDAEIWGGVKITEIGVCYGDSPTGLDIDGPHKVGVWNRTQTKGDAGVVTISIDGLSDATQYYFRGYLKDEDYISYSDVLPFYIPAVPAVQTGIVEDITPYTAVLYGEVLDECGSPVTERGFVINEGTAAPTVDSDKVLVDGALGVMTATAEGLLPNKTYTFSAYAVNVSGVAYGAPVTFLTLVALPDISGTTVSSITSNSASFSGTVNNDGGETVTEVGFYYSTDSDVDPDKSQKISQEYAAYQRTAAEFAANTLYSAMNVGSDLAMSKASSVEAKAASDGYTFSLDVYGLALKTRYYVKAYAVNSAGVAYGKVTNFETMGEIPTVKTTGTSELAISSVVLSGEVVSDNGERISERGFVWMEGAGTPTTDSHKVKVSGTTGEYNYTLNNLQPNCKYSFCAYAINAEGTSYGEVITFTTMVALPTVTPTVVSSVTSTSATLAGTVKDHGGETVYEVGFYYSTDSTVDPSIAQKKSMQYSADSFSIDITDLAVNTKYYVKSYAVNSAGPSYSTVTEFTTESSYPSVNTLGSSDVTESSALLSGEVVSDNGATITERGFVWTKGSDTPTTSSAKIKVDGTTGSFTATLSDIDPNQKYSFRAYAINSKGTAYGEVMSFSTVTAMPVLAAVEISNITSTSASFSSKVLDHGGATVSEVGFCYSTDPEVNPSTSKNVSRRYSNDSFTIDVNELEIFTKYYVKAYTTNEAGTSYSEIASFTTDSSVPVVNTIGSSDVTASSAKLTATVVTDNGAAITERGFVWVQGEGTPTTSSSKQIVDGTTGDFTATLSSLNPNQKYSFRAYAVNAKGTTYGVVMTFNTVIGLPSVGATTVSGITSTSATFSSRVESHGGETVSEVGFYYSTDPAVDESNSTKIDLRYSSDSFSADVSGLSIYTKYYVKSYVKNSVGIVYGPVINFTTDASTPVVNTIGHSNLTASSVDLTGTVVTDNGAVITERGFVWEPGRTVPTTASNKLPATGTTGDFTATLSGLAPNQTYSYRAYAINGKGVSYGETKEVLTKISLPSVSDMTVSAITSTSARFAAAVASHGGDTVSEVGFYYSTDSAVDVQNSTQVEMSYSTDSFMKTVENLAVCTKYYVKAYVKNSAGIAYSPVISFTTAADIPVVNTIAVSEITESGAVLSGTVVTDNGSAVTERGFVWLKGTDVPTTSSNRVKAGGTTGDYTVAISDLDPNQKYSFRAYAINSVGTSYGEIKTFTTVAGLPKLSALGVSSVTTTSATFTSTVTSHGGETVGSVGFYLSTSIPIDKEKAQKFPMAYVEDRFTYTVEGLSVGTQYYVMAFASNTAGETVNAEVAFKTVSTVPTVVTKDHSEITSSSVKLSGEVLLDNGEPVTERGFLWLKGQTEPTASSAKLKAEGTLGEYTSALTGLDPNQSYSYRAYATNSKGTAFGEVKNFRTLAALPEVKIQGIFEITSTTAEIDAIVTYHGGETPYEAGFLYGMTSTLDPATASKAVASNVSDNGTFYYNLNALTRATQYYVKPYAANSAGTSYGEVVDFKTLPELPSVTTSLVTSVTETSARSGGVIIDDGGEILAKGIVWSRRENPTIDLTTKTEETGNGSTFTSVINGLESGRTYYVRAYATNSCGTVYGDQVMFKSAGTLQATSLEAANSFIISYPGTYSFRTVKGNSTEMLNSVVSAEVLWESFGTSETPSVGDLISEVSVGSDQIYFDVSEPYREGNAVIAAKDASGTILWSWHIWLTDQPQEQVYFNNAGTMMDRNLGATSATPGDVGALGLLYQWGRKDPFLSFSSIPFEAKSTITWPLTVSSDFSKGTIEYAIANPTTFITGSSNGDWYYSGSDRTDNTRWQSEKTIYDPCPTGWRVPDGGDNGVWLTALGESWDYADDPENMGINFSGKFGYDQTIWYPTSGYTDGEIQGFYDHLGRYWSVTPIGNSAYYLGLDDYGYVETSNSATRVYGFGVRCQKEGTGGGLKYDNDFSTSGAISLSDSGTANSYIVSNAGTYSISAVKGNSSESVGIVASAEVLWESFGTDEKPSKGSLVSGAKYKNGKVYFKTSDAYREGNAVVAAKDASGTILWSWHIWLTDQPDEHVYPNNAGTMMDRNLGATSATPGDVGALGLLYQWGRKDPFLSGSSINSYDQVAKSTITWPSQASSNSSNGTIEYALSHPTTFITDNNTNYDWYYTGSSSTDDTRWQSEKTIYDPCPIGWRVPDGGSDGVWASAGFSETIFNSGMSFSISNPSSTWYPASGERYAYLGPLSGVGDDGYYWSVTPYNSSAYCLYLKYGWAGLDEIRNRASGYAVRCFKEGPGRDAKYDNDFSTSGAKSLSDSGTSNSYIVSNAGTYSILAVKGNSSESVGNVASAEVLWESFGTDEKPSKGSLVSGAKYENGKVYFKTSDAYREGNAVVAAKDASGTILWSWHIWLTDQPDEHIYNNNAGTMMDRNLGATSATPGDVGALGLLYQWGRKDPFLSGSSINSYDQVAKSTITWPSYVLSDSSIGTIEYATANPTTFIAKNYSADWYYGTSGFPENTRWQSEKTIYDPCPSGWRVPDGGYDGIWTTAGFSDIASDNVNKGYPFVINSPSTTWYPTSGFLYPNDGALGGVGSGGRSWSVTPCGSYGNAYCLFFGIGPGVNASYDFERAYGLGIRCQKEGTSGGVQIDVAAAKDLSTSGTANSYIVSNAGTYKIPTVKGNSSESVGSVASVEVLWESFGTDETPKVGSLISKAIYENGKIYFMTPPEFREGNAVIAAKNSSGVILWSWHIWFTDQPKEQVYYNNAGTMMDRNLGATSATPGDVGALGLLYQWGRKDPFLGSSSVSSNIEAASTITWPSTVSSNSSTGTIEYAIANPTTFISIYEGRWDWYYTSSYSVDCTRWQTEKTIYDPCPEGWRLPDGGSDGIWATAAFESTAYDDINKGRLFNISNPSTTWYPASGFRGYSDGELFYVGESGFYWALTPYGDYGCCLNFDSYAYVYPSDLDNRAGGHAVRCQKEGTGGGSNIDVAAAKDLSVSGSANSYIVSNAGTYKIPTVKGNSSESVGTVASAEVLWESFGTSEQPSVGDLISSVHYEDGKIIFVTNSSYREGNAVIAAKDASGTILWSWHIWLTDQPQEQVYYNNAGTMMDRNLGATSATPGDVGALGLLYQWGRKDPFLGSSKLSYGKEPKSTIQWPSAISSDNGTGTIEYVTMNPTTYIAANYTSECDWHYAYRNNSLWSADKTKYDPCPVGWRVPDGGDQGVWSVAGFDDSLFNEKYYGISFRDSNQQTIWYPAANYRNDSGELYPDETSGAYWSATPYDSSAASFLINFDFADPVEYYLHLSTYSERSYAFSVRCQKE